MIGNFSQAFQRKRTRLLSRVPNYNGMVGATKYKLLSHAKSTSKVKRTHVVFPTEDGVISLFMRLLNIRNMECTSKGNGWIMLLTKYRANVTNVTLSFLRNRHFCCCYGFDSLNIKACLRNKGLLQPVSRDEEVETGHGHIPEWVWAWASERGSRSRGRSSAPRTSPRGPPGPCTCPPRRCSGCSRKTAGTKKKIFPWI